VAVPLLPGRAAHPPLPSRHPEGDVGQPDPDRQLQAVSQFAGHDRLQDAVLMAASPHRRRDVKQITKFFRRWRPRYG